MSPTFVSAIVGVVLLLLLRGPSVDGHSSPLGHTDKVELLNEAMKLDWRQSLYDGVDRGEGITPSNDAPSQIRLSYIPNGMAISFSTIHPYQAPSEPTVHFGLQPANLGYTATAGENGLINDTYGTLYFHTVLLEMLAWNTTYFYQVDGNPTINSFVTARAPGDPTPFEVLLVGDMGLVNSGDNMKQMKAQVEQTDFYLHIGDISYADDFYLRPNNTYEGSWDTFQDLMEPVTANIPYMTLPGNHEVVCTEVSPFLCPANQNNMTAYRHRFRMPSKESGGTQNLWFSYDYGLVHFIHINTETDFPNAAMGPGTYFNAGPFGNQLQWLEADLIDAQIARQKGETAWIIVSGHRPLYSSKKNQAAVIAAFESLFAKYGVDIYFCGHVHTYERLWPLAEGGIATQQNYVNPTGVVHVVNGAGGNIEGHGQYTPKANSAFNDQSHFGYGRLHVANSSSINWKFFNSADAALIDDIWITKEL